MTDTAQAAADAARATRREAIKEAMNAFDHDVLLAHRRMPIGVDFLTGGRLRECRIALTACLAHLDELERLIAQRDGMPVSDGPDVALPVGGQGR